MHFHKLHNNSINIKYVKIIFIQFFITLENIQMKSLEKFAKWYCMFCDVFRVGFYLDVSYNELFLKGILYFDRIRSYIFLYDQEKCKVNFNFLVFN